MRDNLEEMDGENEAAKPGEASKNDLLGFNYNPKQMRIRLIIGLAGFIFIFSVFIGRLVWFGYHHDARAIITASGEPDELTTSSRPNILDRRGNLLAADVLIASMYAEPHKVVGIDETVEGIRDVLPDLSEEELRHKLAAKRKFIWLKREVTPVERAKIHQKGLAGIGFRRETKRVYPSGRVASHVTGFVSVDNVGLAGMERYVDQLGLQQLHLIGLANDRDLTPLPLSIDLKVQHAVRDEISHAVEKFGAIAGAAVVIDVHTGEILALASLPDFDPSQPVDALRPDRINRITKGTFELGSVFKTFTAAMVLDEGLATLNTQYDARGTFRHGGLSLKDFHGENRILTLEEVVIHSSNIGAAKMALAAGKDILRAFHQKIGTLKELKTELPETGNPSEPRIWRKGSVMTIGFGHGVSVTPLHALQAFAALVNGGYKIEPTFLKRSAELPLGERLVSEHTSRAIRYLMRLNVEKGTAKKANLDAEYLIGGKTGTADKVIEGKYVPDRLLTSFISGFPMNKPRYALYVLLDEPKAIEGTYGYKTAGHNVVPTTAQIVRRIAPLLGVTPDRKLQETELILGQAGKSGQGSWSKFLSAFE